MDQTVNGYDNTFNRLANDGDAQWFTSLVIGNHQWRQTNASRDVHMFQSRRSLDADADRPTQAGTTVTLNDRAPPDDRYNLRIVEIVP